MAILSGEQREQFEADGFLLLEGFYDPRDDIEPIQRGIYEIIGLVADQHGVSLNRDAFTPETYDAGFMQLIAVDRKLGSIVYDAIKQLTPFVRLTGLQRNEVVYRELRGLDFSGIAAGGSAIRVDIPGEEKFRAAWHQEYPGQFRSLDGCVFWSPLRAMTNDIGPVQICRGSHKEGLINVYNEDAAVHGRGGAYALRLVGEEDIITRYPVVAPLTKPGDLLVMDFLTVHASGYNTSPHPRMSMQVRHFNFADPTGRSINWSGSFAAGASINDVHPGLLVEGSRS